MAWMDAKDVAQEWVDKNLPTNLRGQVLQLVRFDSDTDSRFFYANRTATYHHMVTTAIARAARKRGARTNYVTITPDRYREWLSGQSKQDDDATRLAYIEGCHYLVGE